MTETGARLGRIDLLDTGATPRWWLVALLIAINGAVAWNAVFHDPRASYDARHHLTYVDVLAQLRLPSRTETAAFYSPPLPYVAPAIARRAGASVLTAGRIAQGAQLGLSIALTLGLLALCQLLRPGDGAFKLAALALCGMAAVYYRSFAMLRGEPYLATFGVLAAVVLLRAAIDPVFRWRRAASLAALCAAIVLSRQLGALLLGGLVAFVALLALREGRRARSLLATAAIAVCVAAIAWAWFYLGLRTREGTAMAWNVPRKSFALANQPVEFYLGTGDGDLFRAPGRPRFQKQFAPVLYADWWGDYWHYFLFQGHASNGLCVSWRPAESPMIAGGYEGNYETMLAYLGWANRIALLPSTLLVSGMVAGALALVGMLRGAEDDRSRTRGLALVFLLAATTLAGYLWFVVSYPRANDGDTVKATYVFQLVPLVALLGAEALVRLRARSAIAFRLASGALIGAGVVLAPTALTRWAMPLDCWFSIALPR